MERDPQLLKRTYGAPSYLPLVLEVNPRSGREEGFLRFDFGGTET